MRFHDFVFLIVTYLMTKGMESNMKKGKTSVNDFFYLYTGSQNVNPAYDQLIYRTGKCVCF